LIVRCDEAIVPRRFDSKLGVHYRPSDFSFTYDPGVFGPQPEYRSLSAIRGSLRDPNCDGPDPVYSIVMDVGREEHRNELHRRMLLFGVVAYASGRLGAEPVRSQGHIHSIAPHCGWSTPELFEIWQGTAIVYAQERVQDSPGKCVAVSAGPGDKVVVPPGWAHYVVNASPDACLIFGAWCDRQYGFTYAPIRARGGLAWFPILNPDSSIRWEPNPAYQNTNLSLRPARSYQELNVDDKLPIYEQFAVDPDRLHWVSEPARMELLWPDFEP
jgi:glucose-6-phosphate isomerase, archaeal